MSEEIKNLKKQLPQRKYVKLILEAEKVLVGKGKRKRFTEDEAKNLFTGRAVSDSKVTAILKATQKAIQLEKKKTKLVLKMAAVR